ncbi:MAG: V-type ATPase subunit [Oscillospiraceae bacterium]|nr:V-type ATPase subunit [Oscillospiraceae bacterium]
MSKIKDTDYLFLSMLLQAKEAHMVTRDKLERMLAEPTFEDAARIAAECGYEDMSKMDSVQIGEALARRRAEAFEEVRDYVADSALLDVFSLKYDYNNAKVIVKAGGYKPEIEYMLSGGARSDMKDIINAYDNTGSTNIPEMMSDAMKDARSVLLRTNNPQLADIVLDKCYFAELQALAEELDSPQLRTYVQLLIDSANLRTAVRILNAGKHGEMLRSMLIEGGSVGEDEIMRAQTREELGNLFASTEFKTAATASSLSELEREADNAVNAYLAGAKMSNFGPGEVVTYLSALETELMLLRIVLTGKRLGISTEKLKERLRDCYV